MPLAEHLSPPAILFAPQVQDKWQLLRLMVKRLVSCDAIPAEREEEAVQALEARERSVSTGMEKGIAVPHAALEDLSQVVASVALIPQGIDFDSLDRQPASIVVLLLVPKHEKLLHVRTLTEVARRLGDPEFRRRVLATRSGEDLVALWS